MKTDSSILLLLEVIKYLSLELSFRPKVQDQSHLGGSCLKIIKKLSLMLRADHFGSFDLYDNAVLNEYVCKILDEFIAADTVVIGAPMYNFSIPSQLKAWLDRLAVVGRTFRYTEAGPEGLLGGKRIIIALASGGHYPEGSPFEHSKSYLRAFFNFVGIQPEFIDASGVAMGLDGALAGADRQIEALAA